jgi:hypothetical protein
MIKGIRITLVAIIVLLFVGGMIWNWSYYSTHSNDIVSRTFTGRIYFDKLNEYSQFKQYLATHPEVNIVKLETLSSPDTLVDFELRVNSDMIIPYGVNTETLKYNPDGEISVTIMVTGLVVVLIIISLLGHK